MKRGLRNWAYTSCLLPMFERERHAGLRQRMETYDRLGKMQPEAVQEISLARLNAMLAHAYATVPFYRERLHKAGYRPGEWANETGMRQIPELTRQDMLNHADAMWSRAYKKEELLVSATGGTTSTPVTFLRDREAVREKTALQWHLNGWAGLFPGDSVFHLWGAQVDYATNPGWRWRMYERYFLRCVWRQTSKLNDQVFAENVRTINEQKPKAIYAYSTPLVEFCEYLQRAKVRMHRPQTVICTAELLTPEQRHLIEDTLECGLYMHYGSRELAMTGAECVRRNMHTISPALFLESMPLDAGSEVCEVIATDLLNRGMPLIRYKINDCVLPAEHECRCGSGFPLMGEVIGRVADMLIMPDGSKLPGITMSSLIVRVMKDWPGISEVQFVQNEMGAITMRYVAAPGFREEDVAKLLPRLREHLHPEIRWDFKRVAEIAREKSGKTRFAICTLPRETMAGAAQ